MKIITSKPIIVNGKSANNEWYSSALGTDPKEIMAFQAFAKSKGADLGKSGANKDGVDGIVGSKTKSAYAKYGAEWEASKTSNPAVGASSTVPTSTGGSTSSNPAVGASSTAPTSTGGSTTDTASGKDGSTPKKGLSTMAWIGIGAGSLLLIGVIYFIAKPSKDK